MNWEIRNMAAFKRMGGIWRFDARQLAGGPLCLWMAGKPVRREACDTLLVDFESKASAFFRATKNRHPEDGAAFRTRGSKA